MNLNQDPRTTKIMVAGDWHASLGDATDAIECALRYDAPGCDTILHLGDFGYWPRTKIHDEYLDLLQELLQDLDARLFFIDGNHEDHIALRRLPVVHDGTCPVRERISWIPRGTRWVWHQVRFGAFGGAHSIDRDNRVENINWFPQESPTETDLQRLGLASLDVLATHDAPSCVSLRGVPRGWFPDEDFERAAVIRRFVDRAVENTSPKLVLHGHWHQRHCTNVPVTRRDFDGVTREEVMVVQGFAQESARGNYGILDLTTLEITANG